MRFDQDAHVGQYLLALFGKDALELHLTLTLLPDGFHDALLGLGYHLGFVEEYPVQPPRAGGHALRQKLLHTALQAERVHNRLAVALPIVRPLVSIDDGLHAEDPVRGCIEPDSEFTLWGLGTTFRERLRAHDASSFRRWEQRRCMTDRPDAALCGLSPPSWRSLSPRTSAASRGPPRTPPPCDVSVRPGPRSSPSYGLVFSSLSCQPPLLVHAAPFG